MSGGVDSAVAAAILQQKGYEVIGVTMQIWPSDKPAHDVAKFSGCCGLDAVEDAKRIAYQLGIRHYVMNFRDIFAQRVIAHFCREYSLGRTPNPCIKCNQYVKFSALLERAKELDVERVATGHYARIEKDEDSGRCFLKKAVDRNKDQSYVLYPISQEQLKHILFPVGIFTKEQVRVKARELGLPVASKPDSQEICFIPDNDYAGFLKGQIPQAARPGPITDKEGHVLGKHKGTLFYTVGQRKGLSISAKEPLYVIAIQPEMNTIVVGGKQEVYGHRLTASDLNWIAVAKPGKPFTAKAKIRYHHQEAEAVITPLRGDRAYIEFREPQAAITPGQSIVFYEGDIVIGGGTVELTESYFKEYPESANNGSQHINI